MNLPKIDELEVAGKSVIVRADLDVPTSPEVTLGASESARRLEVLLPTINKLLEKGAMQLVIIGHRGRLKDGDEEMKNELSNRHLVSFLSEKLGEEVVFVEDFSSSYPTDKILLFENLRFWPGEEENSEEFVSKLAELGNVYVNEAFASSHREHASIVGLPKRMPHAAGEHLVKEVEQLSKLLVDPERPFVSLLSGVKEDKVTYLDKLISISDKVLVGGRLPEYLGEDYKNEKVVLARLIQDKEDITLHTVEAFEQEVTSAKTILLSGPMGKFEEEGHRLGTQRVMEAIAKSDAYKIAGGGDTEAAISLLGLEDKFDWISTGGGAMLDFIVNGTLPGVIALNE